MQLHRRKIPVEKQTFNAAMFNTAIKRNFEMQLSIDKSFVLRACITINVAKTR